MAIAILGNGLDLYIMGYSTCEEIQPEEVIAAFNPPPTHSRLSDLLQQYNNLSISAKRC
jgi:hypothetical protein